MARKPNPALQEKLAAFKRDQILQAARAVFAEKGFHRSTIKDVATRAGVADGTVYNYFENKTALILGLLDHFNQSDQRETDFKGIEEIGLEAFVRQYTHQRFELLGSEGLSLFQAILPEILSNEDLRTLYRERIVAPTFAAADRMIAPAIASDQISQNDAQLVLRLEAAMFVGLMVLRIIGDDYLEANWDKLPDTISDLMLKAFGLTGEPS
jgi:AcrR family transcriptional regulator